jgi:sodium-dependent phosphate cotransporter
MDSGTSFWQTSLARFIKLVALLYLFFISIDLLSCSFKVFGLNYESQFKAIIAVTANPLVALCLGILITSVIQSSSTTTSIIVAVVAEGSLPVSYAIPMIMGANIGTTVTGILVSLGHITRRQEFERAYSAATVHDFFNLLTVSILLPL